MLFCWSRRECLCSPKLTTSLMAGYLLSCIFILGAAFLMSVVSSTVYTPWELEAVTALPVLASYCLRPLLSTVSAPVHQISQEYFDE